MLTLVIAVLAALCNAVASVAQRLVARKVPNSESFRPVMLLDLARHRTWWIGIGGVIGGAVCQAAALSSGRISMVQPILATELPLTLLIAAAVFHRGFGRRAAIGALCLTVGVAVLLVSVSPSGGSSTAPGTSWLVAGIATAVFLGGLVCAGLMTRAGPRAALLGTATATGFAFTAALMKEAMGKLAIGIVPLLTTWQTYAAIGVGIGTLFLLQNALQAGTLAASQPAVTVGDALLSIIYGVTLYGEELRLGMWTIPAIAGLALISAGAVELSRSPLVTGQEHKGDMAPT